MRNDDGLCNLSVLDDMLTARMNFLKQERSWLL